MIHISIAFLPPSVQDIRLKKECHPVEKPTTQRNLFIWNDMLEADELPKQGSEFWVGECPLPFVSILQLNAWLDILVMPVVGVAGEAII